ncbi:MAG: AraC family transcriptional regulator [Lachnospiraceae bacterium]|nr:AraC family transcriptional regulator [Lachnospiraceae bacterium]
MKNISKQTDVNAEELFRKYMYVMCNKESEKTYRLKSDAGEGIMHNYEIASGIELVYSELESYYPLVKEVPESVDYIEIMYMVEGHADFEMENRRVSSADKGDICIFNSRIGAKKISFGKGGIRCISIVLLVDTLQDELNRFFGTNEFDNKPVFEYAVNADSCISFAANEMLRTIFTELVLLPVEYGEFHRKLLTIRAILALLDIKAGKKSAGCRYFSGDSANKVHAARKLLGEDLASDISIEELAEKVKLNRTTLQRVFKQMYGVTVFEYRTQARMQESKNLLVDNNLTVTEIAGLCGYTNASKFSAVFKKNFGITPTDWRNTAFPD